MAKINFMDRDNLLREFELTEDVITVGREATNQIVIPDPSVSRHHANLERREDGFHLVDKNSSNGTYVNGKRVSQQKLNDKDKVNFGSASVVFEDEEQGAATFILPRPEMPAAVPPMGGGHPNDRATDALPPSEEMLTIDEDTPLPPPVPLLSMPSSRPQAPAPPPPASAAPAPPPQSPPRPAPPGDVPTPVGVLCPNCRKVVEGGARFCGFCGTPLSAQKPTSAPAPAPPPPPAAPRPASAPAAPAPPRSAPAPAPMPAAPKFQTMAAPAIGNQMVAPGNMIYAGFGPRLAAYLIDAVILLILAVISMIPAGLAFLPALLRNEPPSPFAPILMIAGYLLAFVLSIGYQLYFVGVKGATIGKKIMKLKVTMADGTYPIGFGKAFLRFIGYMISGLICYIGFLMIAFDKEQHRGLHDKIAGTVVIKES